MGNCVLNKMQNLKLKKLGQALLMRALWEEQGLVVRLLLQEKKISECKEEVLLSAPLISARAAATQALRAGEIIRSLREFIRRGEADRQPETVSTLLSEGVALAFIGINSRGIDMDIAVDPRVGRIMANRVQVQQVITNLVRNAVEAMEGRPMRILHLSAAPDDDGRVEIIVADSGPGLDPGVERSLFTPFSTTKPTGMGVGLSISRTIVEGHGGRIWADASHWGGVAFHFTLDSADRLP